MPNGPYLLCFFSLCFSLLLVFCSCLNSDLKIPIRGQHANGVSISASSLSSFELRILSMSAFSFPFFRQQVVSNKLRFFDCFPSFIFRRFLLFIFPLLFRCCFLMFPARLKIRIRGWQWNGLSISASVFSSFEAYTSSCNRDFLFVSVFMGVTCV